MGDMFGKLNDEMMGFLEAVTYTVEDNVTWETEPGKIVPKGITVAITYRVIHGKPPALKEDNGIDDYKFYGYTGG